MTQFNLILELLNIFEELLEAEKTGYNVRHARRLMDIAFNRFEEMDGVEVSEMGTILDTITLNILNMSPELKDYFRFIESCQTENETYPHDFPIFDNSSEFSGFATDFLTIINDLLQTGITPCTAHHAHLLLDDLFEAFEYEAEELEALAEDNHTSNALNHFFPDLQEQLDGLTLFFV